MVNEIKGQQENLVKSELRSTFQMHVQFTNPAEKKNDV